ncbi:HlyD family efflux transporter periplasmic adaptor subunit [Agathobaculum sp.]|uniref:HlyD family efflux transporter periplasmic adaptor subunit n=1 Tax=Agathobaculum sp. TaxID=2048138 RepID=UPI002A8050F1|nr:HlyD family efflux transporter periplasmic adaptor subunit [Agathobaculum sp.]MDY3619439.1 HlyD family efflux transporter periplasmic adaptor subunit [Agathobaculum sp.]
MKKPKQFALPWGKDKKRAAERQPEKAEQADAAAPGAHRKKKKKRNKKVLIPIVIVLIAVGCFGARHFLGAKKGGEMQTYTESVAERRDIQLTLSSTGTVAPANQYDVTASVKGEVLSSTFEEGDEVKKGDVLYEIDKTDAQNSIDQAKLSLQQSQNSYSQTLESLDDLKVKADASGVVTELHVSVGDQVQNGTAIADIRDSSTMELKVPFNASDADSFGMGAAATVTMDGSFETLSGTVSAIDAAETVLDGYQIVKYVTIRVSNPGGLSTTSAATATVNGAACNQGANFTYLSESTITAGASGKITSLSIREGSSVSKNQVVASLSSTSTENQVSNSKLSLEQAQLSYQKTVDQLDDYTITAPIDGTVITKNTKVGDTLDATNGQTTLAVIYDLSYLTFDIALDELDVGRVEVGQTVRITCDSLTGAGEFEGEVTKVSVAGTTQNGVTTYPVTVRIDDPPDGLLPGMNVDATIVVDEAPDTLAVPIAAVQRGNTVYVKKQGAKNTDGVIVGGTLLPDGWEAVEVETGLTDDSYIEIVSGLSEDDIVFVPQIQRESSGEPMEMVMGGAMPAGGGIPSGGGGGMPSGGGGMPSGGGMGGGGGMP